MLGRELHDQTGRDGDAEGLGLLALRTTLDPEKRLRERTEAQFSTLEGVWQGLSEQPVAGYEIRHGRSEAIGPLSAALPALSSASTCMVRSKTRPSSEPSWAQPQRSLWTTPSMTSPTK